MRWGRRQAGFLLASQCGRYMYSYTVQSIEFEPPELLKCHVHVPGSWALQLRTLNGPEVSRRCTPRAWVPHIVRGRRLPAPCPNTRAARLLHAGRSTQSSSHNVMHCGVHVHCGARTSNVAMSTPRGGASRGPPARHGCPHSGFTPHRKPAQIGPRHIHSLSGPPFLPQLAAPGFAISRGRAR